ncbi:hypothetical protein ACILG0_04600 [Pseudomonadota bacterium AL_CKDN230030165-1A_HGKHYDSX7]
MKTHPPALRLFLVAIACASITACAAQRPRQSSSVDYRSPSPSAQQRSPESSGQRLTIQSGEGEKLNLPWFIQDTQDWVNSH